MTNNKLFDYVKTKEGLKRLNSSIVIIKNTPGIRESLENSINNDEPIDIYDRLAIKVIYACEKQAEKSRLLRTWRENEEKQV